MNWAHLPVPGGLYDQHPKLLEEFGIIFRIQGEHDRQEAAKQKAKQASTTRHPGRRSY